MPRSAARRWLRWPLAAPTVALLVVWALSNHRAIELPTLGGIETFFFDGRVQLRTPPHYWAGVTPTLWWQFSFNRAGDFWWLKVPVFVFALPMSGVTLWLWWPRPTAAPGLCPKCGYDRTGLKERTVCPECGAGSASAPR